MNNYDKYASVTNMLKYLGWPTLGQRRKELRIATHALDLQNDESAGGVTFRGSFNS